MRVTFDVLPEVGRTYRATLSFISDKAPYEVLRAGSRFELTEGKKIVAQGVVVH